MSFMDLEYEYKLLSLWNFGWKLIGLKTAGSFWTEFWIV